MKSPTFYSILLLSTTASLLTNAKEELWQTKYGSTPDLSYSGFNSFAHLPHSHNGCLRNSSDLFDLALLGAPFDSTVSFRNGARFGPYGIRSGSRRQRVDRGYHAEIGINPYKSNLKILDCGDVPMSPYDPSMAIDQLNIAYSTLLARELPSDPSSKKSLRTITGLALDGIEHPRIITMGGDHTIVLPILRSLKEIYGPISVIHLDAHLDTWDPAGQLGAAGGNNNLSRETHGTFFHVAADEGLLGPSIHLGIRTRLTGLEDYVHDAEVGFQLVTTDMIDEIGTSGILSLVHQRVNGNENENGNGKGKPVYISLDIDVLDPGFAPATGTPESGGWSSREVKRIIRGFKGLNIVGVDVVEVSPGYDSNAEITSILAADLIHEFLSVIVKGDEEFNEKNKVLMSEPEGEEIVRDEL